MALRAVEPGSPSDGPPRLSALAVFRKFLGFGAQAWGGPVAQIGMMHHVLVEEEHWIDEARFRRILGVYQSLPGPEAHELAVYFGYQQRGRLGGFLAGLGFMLPGFVLAVLLAAAYASAGTDFWGLAGLLYGVKPVVIALIVHAVIRLGRATLINDGLVLTAMGTALAAALVPIHFVALTLAFGGVYFLFARRHPLATTPLAALPAFLGIGAIPFPLLFFLFFLASGLLTFGGAYTVIPFLQQGAVEDFGWITPAAFLDAVALCSLLPAPLVIVGTFVGYLVAGWWGALLATVGIFLPAFAFTLVAHDRIVRLVEAPAWRTLFEGIAAAVVGLVAVTAVQLSEAAFPDWTSMAFAAIALLVLRIRRVGIPFVVLAAGLAGILLEGLGGP